MKVCPRCGFEAENFDRLAVQPNYVGESQLMPVHKCPECRHLWAQFTDEQHEVLVLWESLTPEQKAALMAQYGA